MALTFRDTVRVPTVTLAKILTRLFLTFRQHVTGVSYKASASLSLKSALHKVTDYDNINLFMMYLTS